MRAASDSDDTGPLEIDPLGSVLAGLLRMPGMRGAHVVDARRGVVTAVVGAAPPDDGALVQLARAVLPFAAGPDALDDVVLFSRDSVHVLRESEEPGTVLHVCLDRRHGDLDAARRALRVAGLQQAVPASQDAVPVAQSPPPPPSRLGPRPVAPPVAVSAVPPVPVPRPRPAPVAPPLPVPHPRRSSAPGPAGQQPALVTLTGLRPPARAGALAVLALQHVEPRVAVEVPLPRRRPSPRPVPLVPAGEAVLPQAWAQDVGALQRVLAGLRKLA
ncbi:hypothetical protein ACQPWY_20585 [Pseudonocardia xinjiangensis]|uniref:hypothetical protein n=1 Tax=Pseudonocardia xinjiangensis TaxID=75289 RepID=UPI003D8E0432